MLNKVSPRDTAAYTEALAFESFEPKDGIFNANTNTFNNVSFEDIERLARIVAYKVAKNLKLGYSMDPYCDPLLYVDCEDYPCLPIDLDAREY